jgi:hypothetical protein
MSGVSTERLARHFTFARSRVLTSVPPDQVWVFFRDFPTPLDIAVCLISQIRRMLGQSVSINLSVPTTFLPNPSSPYRSPLRGRIKNVGVSYKKMTANNSYKIHFLKRMFKKMEDRKTQISSQTTVKVKCQLFIEKLCVGYLIDGRIHQRQLTLTVG